MHQILQSYLRRLTNLSGSNRSLLLLRLISEQCMDLHQFDYALNQPSFDIVSGLIAKKNHVPLCAQLDSRDKESNRLSTKLKRLQRIEKFIFQERGARDLYMGWPFVRGKFADDTLVRAPLLFFPVSIEVEKDQWILKLRKDVNITFNKSFLLAYSFFNKVALDEELLETTFNDFDVDPTTFRTDLYQLLKQSSIELNFNQENFRDELRPFESFKKADYEQLEKTGQLKLFPEAVLGIFPQAGSYLVPDYINLIENSTIKDLEEFFLQRKREDMEDESNAKYSDRALEENTFTPFDVDASQERALELVKKGNSIIVQGPPGTGKSQLISNLISDYIARGKNVLLVCQKRAALDVVFQRLKDKELHDFIGLVHDFKNDRKDIFEKIAHQIDRLDEYRQKNNGLDTIQLERTFQQASRSIDRASEELNEFKFALFDEVECGKSIKELYISSDPSKKAIALNQEYRGFPYATVGEFKDRLSQYLEYYRELENKNHFWVGGKSFANFSASDLVEIQNTVDKVLSFAKDLEAQLTNILHQDVDFESAEMIASKPEELAQLIQNLDNERAYAYFLRIVKEPPLVKQNWLIEQERTLLQCFKGPGPEVSLKTQELGRFQESLEHAIKARRSPLNWIRWKLFSKDKIFITRVLVANGLKSNSEGFQVLLDRIDNRLNYEHKVSELLQKKWLGDFPKSTRKIDIQNWFFFVKLAFNTYDLLTNLRPLESLMIFYKDNRKDQVATLKQLEKVVSEIPTRKAAWNTYLSNTQIRAIILAKVERDTIFLSLKRDFDKLSQYHQLRDKFNVAEAKIAGELMDSFETDFQPKQVLELFDNSLAIAWIDHIESKYPILRAVSSQKLESLEKSLKEGVDSKKEASSDILLLKSREKTYDGLEYNRLNNLVTYRDLYHQVTKKRRIWPLRRVIGNFSEELFKLIPCWMTSPESASAIFPMQEMFDLVIFDEASQCFAEKAIPALYRGRQVVIAGDSKQLKPFDLYRIRWEDENEQDLPELEIDSLLDLARHHLPETSLTGHYRSRSLELIDFSNLHFYQGRLQMLPDFSTLTNRDKAIEYIKVDGIWDNNINEAEAKQVVQLVFDLLRASSSTSIGVVTFNAKQQGHILDVLEEESAKVNVSIPDTVFVKNIENVQGDERDIVIFSTAYAPDSKGKLQMRFGPLNLEGGENRLNVAVTRARQKVYVVSSIIPSQVRVEDAKNPGPKLLKAYLQYAWDVANGEWTPSLGEPPAKGYQWFLREQLKSPEFHGFPQSELTKNFQFSDLTVQEGKKARGLVLTDDEIFHDALSVKEAFVYYPNHLSEKKWPFTRFYSRNFWVDKQSIKERMKIFLNRVLN